MADLTHHLKSPNLDIAHITFSHSLLVKTWPNIHHEGLEMQPLTR